MKKLLALVLALVMTLSLAVVGSNAAFKDADKVSATYAEAVDVLAGMKVFQGYTDGSFQPEGSITRAEVAAIVYRLYTGDVADKQASLYATYNKFNDMDGASWAKGYIGYCGNAGLIKGYDAKTFGPSDKVTGYQALAMILRAVGYDKNGEFTGADWQLHVAQYAQQLGILQNVKGEDLNAAASRQLVAELLFRTAAEVNCVNYTAALGYTDTSTILGPTKNKTLGEKNFGLTKFSDQIDAWGRPYYTWYGEYNKTAGYQKDTTDVHYATVKATPVKTYTEAVTECQVAEDYGFKATKEFTVYTNGVDNSAKQTLNAINTVNKIGAQGRLTEVYKDRIVYIDTLLAKVTYVANATFDAAGHLKTPATITLDVYDKSTGTAAAPTYHTTTVTETNSSTNYEYAKGDMILVYAVQNADAEVVNTAAKQHIELIAKAESIVGAQSTIWNNNAKHVIGGTTYNDNNRFHFDQAGVELTNHTWYFDSYGNLIGASDIISTNYAVLKDLIWVNGNPGHAEATLIDLKGAESKVTVSSIDGDETDPFAAWENKNYTPKYTDAVNTVGFTTANTIAYVSNDGLYNNLYKGYAMYRVDSKLDGTVALEGYDIVTYKHEAKFASNNSAILTSGGDVAVYVSSNTQYLVRTVDAKNVATYTPVTGTQAMSAYSKADLFYVDYNNDKIADYVYIKGGTLTTAASALVYVTTDAYTGPLTEGATTVYTMVATVNGEAGQTIKLDATTAAKLAANVNKLFKVDFSAGVGNNAKLIDAKGATATGYITGAKAIYMAGDALKHELYTDGATLYSDKSEPTAGTPGFSCRIDNAKVINAATGDYTALTATVLRDNGVWVIYDETPFNTATTIYVGEKLGTDTALETSTVTTGVTKAVSADGKTITFTMPHDTANMALYGKAVAFNATLTYGGTPYVNVGNTWPSLTPNTYTPWTVTAEDGVTKTDYTVVIEQAAAPVVAPVITFKKLGLDGAGTSFTLNYDLSKAIANGDWDKMTVTIKSADGALVESWTSAATSGELAAGDRTETINHGTTVNHDQTFKVTMTISKGDTVVATSGEVALHLA